MPTYPFNQCPTCLRNVTLLPVDTSYPGAPAMPTYQDLINVLEAIARSPDVGAHAYAMARVPLDQVKASKDYTENAVRTVSGHGAG